VKLSSADTSPVRLSWKKYTPCSALLATDPDRDIWSIDAKASRTASVSSKVSPVGHGTTVTGTLAVFVTPARAAVTVIVPFSNTAVAQIAGVPAHAIVDPPVESGAQLQAVTVTGRPSAQFGVKLTVLPAGPLWRCAYNERSGIVTVTCLESETPPLAAL
jgi:hypothetical protein